MAVRCAAPLGVMPLLLLLGCVLSAAAVPFGVPNVIGSNMVLQSAPLRASVWGFGPAGATVNLTVGSDLFQTTIDADGRWRVVMPAREAGPTEYTLVAMCSGSSNIIRLERVLFGDVFLCSGQSNMLVTVRDDLNATATLAEASNYSLIRVMTVTQTSSLVPKENLTDALLEPWSVNSAAALGGGSGQPYFSAVCYYFGLTLHKKLNKPIGLVGDAYSGTIVEAWSPKESLEQCQNLTFIPLDKQRHSSLFNAMIYPFLPMTIRGAIWYQGEENMGNEGNYAEHKGYACSFPKMIEGWRHYFSQKGETDPAFPFGFVVLPGFCHSVDHTCNQPDTVSVPELRFAQMAESVELPNGRLPNTFYATGIDLMDAKGDVHPRYKKELGTRLGQAALRMVYGVPVAAVGPILAGCETSGDSLRIDIKFDFPVGESLVTRVLYGFEVREASTKKWMALNITTVSEHSLLLTLGSMKITGLRYLWERNPCCPEAYSGKTSFSCPYLGCPVYSKQSNLPLTGFRARVVDGKCDLSLTA